MLICRLYIFFGEVTVGMFLRYLLRLFTLLLLLSIKSSLYIFIPVLCQMSFPGSSVVKNLPAMQETWVRSLSEEDPLKKEMATHSSILAWEIPWMEESGRLQSLGSQKSRTQLSN